MTPEDSMVIVAVQDAGRAKSRLGPQLDPGTRRTLVLAMLDDLLSAVREAWPGRVLVVSADAVYDAIAREHNAEVLRDGGTGYNEAVMLALAQETSTSAALVLPGDLPHATPGDIRALLEATGRPGVVIAPSEDGGTLALGLHPIGVIAPAFGPASADVHETAARASGATVTVVQLAGLRNDVDTLEDLAAVWDQVGEATTALLEHLPLPSRGARRE